MASAADPIVSFGFALRVLREAGVSFDDAWDVCLPAPKADRGRTALREALTGTRSSWRRAFDGEPPERAEVAAVMLASVLGDEAADATDESATVVG